MGHLDGSGETQVSAVADPGFSGISVLGGNKDDSEGGTGTVDGGRGCVFQYRDVGDVIGVDRVHVAFYTVDEDQRRTVGAGSDSTSTADGYVEFAVQGTAAVAYRQLKSGDLSLQGLCHISYWAGCYQFGVDGTYRTGYVDLLLGAVSYNYDFI